MKTILLTAMLFISSFSPVAYCQLTASPSQCVQDKEYKWNIGVQINTPERQSPLEAQMISPWTDISNQLYTTHANSNSTTKDKTFAASITIHYHFKENIFLRCKTGINKVDIEHLPEEFLEDRVPATVRLYSNAWKKRNDFIGAIGIGRSMEIKHFNFYAGIDVPFTYYGKTQFYSIGKDYDIATGALTASDEYTGTLFSAYSIGIGNFAGFSFMFRHFSIGGEISYAFLYNKATSASTDHDVNINYLVTTNGTTTTDGTNYLHISNFDFSKVKTSITVTYSF